MLVPLLHTLHLGVQQAVLALYTSRTPQEPSRRLTGPSTLSESTTLSVLPSIPKQLD
jgi:hypothetical protein